MERKHICVNAYNFIACVHLRELLFFFCYCLETRVSCFLFRFDCMCSASICTFIVFNLNEIKRFSFDNPRWDDTLKD